MVKTVGYLVTWVTYGTWLQGDGRGYVKDGRVLGSNEHLQRDNESRLVKDALWFGAKEKRIVKAAIIEEAVKYEIDLKALSVCSNHVHVVVGYSGIAIGQIVRQLKQGGRLALKKNGLEGRVWANGYDKRFCFDEKSLRVRVGYVNKHNDGEV